MSKLSSKVREKTQLLPVHVSAKEIIYMNAMQKSVTGKGQMVDPETGLRAYPGLSLVIENPETKRLFIGALHAIKTHAKMPPELQETFDHNNQELKQEAFPSIPSDHNEGVHQLAKSGQGNDKLLVMMPLDVIEFLESIEGVKRRDPKLGLDEFAFFDDVFEGVGVAMHAAKQREPHFWGALAGVASIGLGAWLGNQADQQEQSAHEREMEEIRRQNEEGRERRQAIASRWNSGGLKIAAMSPKPVDRYKQHGFDKPRGGFKKGGFVLSKPIVGKGDGQEDLIHVDVPQNSWIDNATFVSDAGNGSSSAGHKKIEQLDKYIAKNHLKKPHVVEQFKAEIAVKPLQDVPCALSHDERSKKPILVAAYGQGSMKKGSDVLRDMVTEVRKIKTSNGLKLPPPCPDLITLYKRTAHKHGMEV
jgi:hypothetical protein